MTNSPKNKRLLDALLLGVALAGAIATATVAQETDPFPGVEALMSADEYRAAGLEKLSDEEKQALDAWLLRYTAGDAEVLQESSEAVRKARKDYTIESRIVGDFTGWTGKTYFKLENGQLWQQRLNGRYRYDGPANPEVRIERNVFGFYRMTVVESGRSIGVSLRP